MRAEAIKCGAYANQSEADANETLLRRLKGSGENLRFLLLSNLASAVNDRAIPDEIDLVAIGSTGLFVIEIKHWDRSYLKSHPQEVSREADKLNEKVKRLVGRLRRGGIDPGFVVGRFLLTKETSKLDAQHRVHHGSEFFVQSEWKQLLSVGGDRIFDDGSIDRAAQILEPLTKIAINGEIRRLANVRNLELQSPQDDRFHRIYRGEHVRSRDKVIVHLYDVSAAVDPKADRIASREFDALNHLQKLRCVPRLMDSFHEVPDYPGELWYFSLVDHGAPSVEARIADKHWTTVEARIADKHWTTTERRAFAVAALKALQEIHEFEVDGQRFIHRQISPQTLLVDSANQPIFTAFDLARISGTMTVSPGAMLKLDAPCFAPEVRTQGLGVADQRSDVFALCFTLSALFSTQADDDALFAIEALVGGQHEKPEQRSSIEDLISRLEGKQTSEAPRSALPSVRYWSEGLEVPFNNSRYRILSRLGTGSFGTTFKVAEINREQEVGIYAAKVIFDRESGNRSLLAFRSARQHSKHPRLATIYEINNEWQENSFVALLEFVDGTPLPLKRSARRSRMRCRYAN